MSAEMKNWKDTNRLILRDVIPLETPLSVGISVSTKCNFKCKYCMHSLCENKLNSNYFTKEIMEMDVFHTILNQLCKFPQIIKKIDLYGTGEPLLNKNLPEMIYELKNKQICRDVDFITNGYLFSPELSDRIVDAGVNHIRISLQGLSSEMYYETCGVKIDFGKFVSQISYLYNHKKQAKIMLKIMSDCITEEERNTGTLYQIFGEIADTITIENILPLYGDVDYTGHTSDDNVGGRSRYGELVREYNVCPVAFYRMVILPNGYVTPCCDPLKAIYWGNLNERQLVDIWNSAERTEFLKKLLRKERKNFEPCKNCFVPNDIFDARDSLDCCSETILNKK